jgi:hypothetical protein
MTAKILQLHHYRKAGASLDAMTFGEFARYIQAELDKNPWYNNIPVQVWDQHYGDDDSADDLHTLSIYSMGEDLDEKIVMGFNVDVEIEDKEED